MSDKKDIGNALKAKMDGYTTTPRVNLWPAVEAELKRKKKRMFFRIILLFILILFISAISFFVLNSSSSSPDDPTKTEINPMEDDDTNTQDNTNDNTTNSDNKKNVKNIDLNTVEAFSDRKKESPELNPTVSSSKQNGNQNNSNSKSSKGDRNGNASNPKSRNSNSKGGQNDLSLDLKATVNSTKDRNPGETNLSPIDLIRLGELKLKIDSIQLYKGKDAQDSIKPKEEKDFNWSLFPYVSLDHYNAFGLTTTEQHSFNYGVYLSYYSQKRLLLRSGFKSLNLQYNFQNNERQQQVSYSEIPMEARYFITHKLRFKSSFIVGGSYLFLQSATLIDFSNNLSRDNRDTFNRNIFSLNAGLGLHYDLSKRWRVNLEYIFEYHPTPYTRRRDYTPYNSSLSFGVEYRFFWK